ncbi:MAG: DegT/DnrJ/EryC1/StrS family aminotransferase, partial [Candidatus Sumerlaeota bacterium]|nr:DegT/DnrJ/EryC1/StrS family aminotransferase [Candidatus Sumerlaeota bacterium]
MRIPLVNLQPQHSHLVSEILDQCRRMFEEGDFVAGQAVKDFERVFAQYIGARQAVAVASVSDALLLTLRGLDIMPGDEVLAPAYGPISSVDIVARLFANPVFVDIEPHSFGLDPMKLQESISEKSRAIIASHLYGNPCTIDQIHQFAEANGLIVIEDVTQAAGATYMNKKLGTIGAAGCFSFYPTANLGGAGNGGMIVTDDEELAARLRRLREHGRSDEAFVYDEVGLDSRMNTFQAIALKRKLEELDESNSDRIENARLYERLLANAPVKRPRFTDDGSHVYSHYVVEHDQRDQLAAFLAEKGIEAKAYYPLP